MFMLYVHILKNKIFDYFLKKLKTNKDKVEEGLNPRLTWYLQKNMIVLSCHYMETILGWNNPFFVKQMELEDSNRKLKFTFTWVFLYLLAEYTHMIWL